MRNNTKTVWIGMAVLQTLLLLPLAPVAEGVGVCRKTNCPCSADQLQRGMVDTKNGCEEKTPCADATKAYDAAVAAQQATQRELNRVNSRQAEKAAMSSNDKKKIADWKAAVKKATKANNDAVDEVSKTFKALDKCKDKSKKK